VNLTVRLVNQPQTHHRFPQSFARPSHVSLPQTREKLAVDVTSVVDVHDVNPMSLFVYLVDDAVAAASGGPEPGELAA
jgi:hypothetical protein